MPPRLERSRCLVVQGTVWANLIVLPSVLLKQDPGFEQGREELTVQELIS